MASSTKIKVTDYEAGCGQIPIGASGGPVQLLYERSKVLKPSINECT
jgi:hypothetical protein